MKSNRAKMTGVQTELIIYPHRIYPIVPGELEPDGHGYARPLAQAQLPALEEAGRPPKISTLTALCRIWLRPRSVLMNVALFGGGSWILPIGLALFFFYAHFAVLAYLRVPHLDWALIHGVAGILVGWPLCAAFLYTLSRQVGGRPEFVSLLAMSAWATLPLTLRNLVQLFNSLSTGQAAAASGLSGLAITDAGTSLPGPAVNFLGYIDIYNLWHLGLLVVVVSLGSKISYRRALVAVAGYAALHILVGSWLPS